MENLESLDFASGYILNESNASTSTTGENSQEENVPLEEEQREKLVRLPLGRIRNIMKTDPEVHLINQEAVFLIAKSTELFIDSLVKEAYKHTAVTKKKTIQKRDVESAVNNVDALMFLDGMME